MQDTIIKGTGNSRTLKMPPNALTIYPTWEAFVSDCSTVGAPIDIGPLNPAGVDVHGTDLTKATLLRDDTAALLGLDSTAVVNDALIALYGFSKGYAQIRLTVRDSTGKPLTNIPITGISDILGNTPLYTNDNGFILGYAKSGSVSLKTSNILGIKNQTLSFTVSAGEIYEKELIAERQNFILFTSSTTVYIPSIISTVDVSAVSGGENGHQGSGSSNASTSGRGGNTGTSVIEYGIDVSNTVNSNVDVVVGGGNGGTSSFLGVEAFVSTTGGGASVTARYSDATRYKNGISGAKSNYQYFSSFTGMAVCGGSGGSGGATQTSSNSPSGGSGGAPFGGNGGGPGTDGKKVNATGYGGGGGGSYASLSNGNAIPFGTGYQGVVSARIHFSDEEVAE